LKKGHQPPLIYQAEAGLSIFIIKKLSGDIFAFELAFVKLSIEMPYLI